jgi:lysophospholipase L1-like esterase
VSKLYWWQERYNAAILKIAAETETKFIDIRGEFLLRADFQDLLCADGIHPNAAGHLVIAEGILGYIRPHAPFLLKA